MKVAVLDIGKTNVKTVIVDVEAGRELASRTRPNKVLTDGPYPHFDVDCIFTFFLESLKELYAEFGFEAISITAHGASGALLGEDGLALPVLDYEFRYSTEIDEAYDAIRQSFQETFSPRLPGGLNLGAQFHYQKTAFPEAFRQVRTIVTYPQYWGWRLTGIAATDVTSLGCHTDLWLPRVGKFSSLVEKLGLVGKLAPVGRPSDLLGHVTDEIAGKIGLTKPVPVYCGIHDSNASLLPHLVQRDAPFAVVSTGTWVVLFAVGGDLDHLDPARDTLANVDALGRAIPSARFMGGREFEMLTAGQGKATPEAIRRVVGEGIFLTPSVVPGCGPYPDAEHRIVNGAGGLDADETYVVASLYCALMTKTCLDLTGASGPIVVEGPFTRNALYIEALGRATERPVIAATGSTGTSVGAALLAAKASNSMLRSIDGASLDAKNRAHFFARCASLSASPTPQADVSSASAVLGDFKSYCTEWSRHAQDGTVPAPLR